jgi:hypothetical protein
MELIRFYFGASGSFLKRLFSGAFALDQLYSAARLNRNSQTANLDLAEDLAGAAAVTVARIAFDQQARSAASWIVNSAVVASANKTRYYPKTTFPFLGETDLTAEGRWIESDGHRVFLAERLVRCTHPFPFSTLFYTTRKSVVSPRRIYGSFAGEQCDADDCASIPHPPMLQLDEGTVSSILQPVAIPGDELDDEPFPDLAQKKIRRVKSIVPNGPATPRHETPQLSTGDETTASDVRAAEIMVDVEDDSSDNALIEELPTEAVDMFSEAFDTYKAASKGRYRLKLPAFDTESVKSRPGPFLRGDAISGTSDTRLARVWCAMIESLEEKCGPVLVMVRDGVTRDHEDHLVLVRIDGDVDSTEEIARCLDEFAKGHLVGPLKQNTLISCRTESATNLYSLLRSLSVGLQRLHSGGTEAEDCLVWPNLTSLQEPLISSDQVAVILHAARQSR